MSGDERFRWEELEHPGPDRVLVDGREVRRGSRVRLRPRSRGDVFDIALSGMTAVVDSIDESLEGDLRLAVTVDGDPGRDLGEQRQPGHRFFFSPEEVEPLDGLEGERAPARRILVAGIGNVFCGDDGFGIALANRLAERELPAGVEVVDFGIRGMDLAFAMQDDYDAVVLLDASPRGEPPGTLYVIEPGPPDGDAAVETHAMDPVRVLALVGALGGTPPRTLVVGCEPQTHVTVGDEEIVADLSEPVRLALHEAERLVHSVLEELTVPTPKEVHP